MKTHHWPHQAQRDITITMCGCIGPQNGEPLCPCRMRGLRQVDGRWVETIDHGPVRPHVPRPVDPTVEAGDPA